MAKKHISVTDERVLRAMEESKNASRLIEEAVLYYLDRAGKEYITREQVQEMIGNAFSGIEIKNPNYNTEQLKEDIASILDL